MLENPRKRVNNYSHIHLIVQYHKSPIFAIYQFTTLKRNPIYMYIIFTPPFLYIILLPFQERNRVVNW